MYNRERIYRQMPEDSDNSVMGLSERARNHFVRYTGFVTLGPLVEEMIDVHGEEAQELIEVLEMEGRYGRGRVLDIGTTFAVENPNRKDPNGNDWYLYRAHKHPDVI